MTRCGLIASHDGPHRCIECVRWYQSRSTFQAQTRDSGNLASVFPLGIASLAPTVSTLAVALVENATLTATPYYPYVPGGKPFVQFNPRMVITGAAGQELFQKAVFYEMPMGPNCPTADHGRSC